MGNVAVFLLLTLLNFSKAQAQPYEESKTVRRSIGLVLSSGGARGLAHIGVLRAFEEAGIPIDYISGSSMGCIVGALYACGYSAGQLDSLVRIIDWAAIFEGKPKRQNLKPLQRERESDYLFRLELNTKGLHFPVSLFSSHQVDQHFFRLTAPSNFHAEGHFDRLPIPFRAATVDLRSGKIHILREGCLARAMRASMSIPVLFPPAEVNGGLLVDGGMVDNLPTDAMAEWDPQVVLAVDVSSDLPIKTSPYNFIDVGRQVIKVWMRVSNQPVLEKPSLLIKPDLGNHSPLVFGRVDWLIQQGYRAAWAKMDSVRLLAGEPLSEQENASRSVFGWEKLKVTRVGRVRVEENQGVHTSLILDRFAVQCGDWVDPKSLEAGVANLQSLNLFREVWIDLKPMETGEAEIVLHAPETEHRSFQVFGNYTTETGVLTRFCLKDENLFKNSECLSLGFQWGNLSRLGQVFFQKDRIFRSSFFIEGRGALGTEEALYFRDGEERGRFRYGRQRAEISFGLQFKYSGWASLGMYVEKGSFEGPKNSSFERQNFLGKGIVLHTKFDHLDRTDFPKRGYFWDIEGVVFPNVWGNNVSFTSLFSRWASYFPIRTGMTLSLWSQAGFSEGNVPYPYLFRIGGPETLPGFHHDELWGNQTVSLGTAIYHELKKFFVLKMGVVGSNVWKKREAIHTRKLRWGAALGFAVRTPFGPVSMDWGWGEHQHFSFYASVGYN